MRSIGRKNLQLLFLELVNKKEWSFFVIINSCFLLKKNTYAFEFNPHTHANKQHKKQLGQAHTMWTFFL